VPRDDLLGSFRIARNPAVPSPDGRPEPRFGAVPLQVELDEARRMEVARTPAQPSAPSQFSGRTLPFGMLGALAVHLSPLLLLLSWTTAPAEIDQPIPIELVLEQPPPPPPEPKPEQKAEKPAPPPPLGRLASVDMGEPVKEPQPPASSPEQQPSEAAETQVAAARPPPPPDLVSALPKPVSPPEPLSTEPPLPEPAPPRKPAPKPVVATPHPPKPQPARPMVVPGPAASRDEYLAYITSLINRQSHLLAPSVLGGRRGVAVISIMVLGDGTIARLRVKHSSGYPDIDARIEQMVAAVRRFPPLPQWIQAPSVMLDYHRVFPDRFGAH
jgi:TonB family protein